MDAIELRKKKNVLETKINTLLTDFLNDVGSCEIQINVRNITTHSLSGDRVFFNVSAKIDIII